MNRPHLRSAQGAAGPINAAEKSNPQYLEVRFVVCTRTSIIHAKEHQKVIALSEKILNLHRVLLLYLANLSQ